LAKVILRCTVSETSEMDCFLHVGAEWINAGKLQMNFTLCRLRTDPGIMHLTDTNLLLLLLNTPKYENETAENGIECSG
jgi:hypothetical protein